MEQGKIIEDIASLFIKTNEGHHKAFIKTNGVDPEWPLWYANYLFGKLGSLLNAELTKSDIIYLLIMLEQQRTLEAPGSNWPKYYAKILVDRYL